MALYAALHLLGNTNKPPNECTAIHTEYGFKPTACLTEQLLQRRTPGRGATPNTQQQTPSSQSCLKSQKTKLKTETETFLVACPGELCPTRACMCISKQSQTGRRGLHRHAMCAPTTRRYGYAATVFVLSPRSHRGFKQVR